MGAIHVNVTIRNSADPSRSWRGPFRVDTGATDSVVPRYHLEAIGVTPGGQRTYELADGSAAQMDIAVARIEFMGEFVGGTVVFGDPGTEPLLGVTALESMGVEVGPQNQKLRKLSAVRLKRMAGPELTAFSQTNGYEPVPTMLRSRHRPSQAHSPSLRRPDRPSQAHSPSLRRPDRPSQAHSPSLRRPDRPSQAHSPSLRRPERPPQAHSPSLRRPERPSQAHSPSLRRPERPSQAHSPSLRRPERPSQAHSPGLRRPDRPPQAHLPSLRRPERPSQAHSPSLRRPDRPPQAHSPSLRPSQDRQFNRFVDVSQVDDDILSIIAPVVTAEGRQAIFLSRQELTSAGLKGVAKHLCRSSECIIQHEWADSVRESIHAVELVIDPKKKGLKRVLQSFQEQNGIHPALMQAVLKLWGYASNEPGIRHALPADGKARVDSAEAEFMYSVCASLARFLCRKHLATLRSECVE